MVWDQAFEGTTPTEPGGQANKPYMMGADSSTRGGLLTYTCRLQSANSFFIARLTSAQLASKLYAAEIYLDPQGDGNWELVARLNYQWQHWTISDSGIWTTSSWSFSGVRSRANGRPGKALGPERASGPWSARQAAPDTVFSRYLWVKTGKQSAPCRPPAFTHDLFASAF